MQNQIGQMEEIFQERQSCVLSSNTDPRTELNVITSMDGLTLDGSFIPNSLVYRRKEQSTGEHNNPTRRADHFVYGIDIVNSLCDNFPIENNSMSGNPTPSSDSVVESPSPSPIPYKDSDSLVEDTDTLLSHFDNSPPEYETFSFDIEEKSSGSTTTRLIILFGFDVFVDDDHIKEMSSGQYHCLLVIFLFPYI
ncbi:hypothetical protein Tco_0838312 [Tanacetum coccineum]|uniref:Uncharacterized protein n=1 Tax=Tanacetum coccineum TaxID=301880 RepID=A0ABQ5AME0_9ASTR